MILDTTTALTQTRRNRQRKYPGRGDPREADGMIFPAAPPGVRLSPGQSVFTIGSCFARNVEAQLQAAGLNVPTLGFSAPPSEAAGKANRLLNQYNPATMLQVVSGVGGPEDSRGLYRTGAGETVDALLSSGGVPVTPERAVARRAEIATLYEDGLGASDVAIVTLGLVEVWRDEADGIWLNDAPPRALMRDEPGRFSFHRLDVATCRSMVESLVDTLSDGGRHVILTVSPVPLRSTFTGEDAAIANAYSKSVLRVVADEVVRRAERADYFPSYEMIQSAGTAAFAEDLVHVRPAFVARVISTMLGRYLVKDGAGASGPSPDAGLVPPPDAFGPPPPVAARAVAAPPAA